MGGGKKPVSQQPKKALGIDFQGAQYGPPIPVVYGKNKVAGNCIWYGDFQAIAQQQKQSGGKGGGGSSSTTSYTYKASYQLALCEGPISSVPTVYNGTSTTTLSALGAVLATGTSGQAAWSHLSGAAAIGYSNTAVVSFANRDLGSQASLPNDNFEVAGLKQYGGSIVDADFSAVFSDICTDPQHGLAGIVPLGSVTQWSNYCVAASLFVSPVYDQQDTAQSALEDLLKYGNAAAWFSEGVLKVGCYGDQTITGNGVTYTPDLTSVASLGPDDFITNGNNPPVTITRTSPADALNLMRVEYKDRANTYHDSVVVASIDEDVIANGGRSDDSESVDMATTAAVASQIAWNLLQRKFYVRNNYQFKLSWRYCYLEPFDIVDLTDANTGLSAWPVRLLSVEEDEHGLLDITAEECPEGIGHAATVATQGNSGTTVDPNADPGPVAGPYLFRGPGFLVGNNKPEIWCAVTGDGNPLWAGCDVYLSHDGTSYTYVCSYARQARYGHITNSMAVQADPDTVSAPNVVLNGNGTQLLGGSQADADQFITLAMIDDEIVSYETATLAAGPSYNLSYLRRGGYGTTIAAHSANAPFVRLDDGILRIPVDPSQIGATIYLKFLSVNCFGRTPRTLSGETAYTYVIGTNVELPDVPVVPDNFTVTPVADGVSITWLNDNPAAVGCTSIEYSTASGGPWTALAQCGPTHTSFHHSFTSGATYYYRARSRGPLVQSGWSAYTATLSSTGVNVTGPGGSSTLANANIPPVINPQFAAGDLTGWTSDFGTWTYQSGTNGPESGTSQYAIRTGSVGTPTDTLRNIAKIPVYPGAVVKAACSIKGSGTPNGTCSCLISWRDSSDAELSVTQGNTITGNVIAASFATAAAPANAAFAHVEAAAIAHTTGSYAVDGFIAPILPDSLDQVPDSATRFASPLSQAIILAGNTPGGNMVPNPMFALGMLDWSPGSGWFTSSFNAEPIAAIGLSGTARTSILQSFMMPIAANVALSAGIDLFQGANFTAGDVSADFEFFNSSGGLISRSARIFQLSAGTGGFVRQTLQNFLTPAGCTQFHMRIFIEGATGSGTLFVKRIKVERGTVCTPWNDDATQFGNQLTNAGSGQQLGDQRNTPSSLSRGYGTVRSATALTAHSTGAIDVNAHSITMGAAVISYNAHASAITGCAVGSTQYVYTRDNYAGGSPTWLATTSAATANSFDDAYIAGNVTIPSSGTSGGGSPGGGSGAGCVGVNMFVRGNLRAKDARRWSWLWMARRGRCFPWLQSERLTFSRQPCVRIVAEGGFELECSISTPFDLRDGSMTFAPDMYGHEVLTRRRWWQRKRWRKVVDVIGIGMQLVAHIHAGGRSYAAGTTQHALIYSHNPVK